MNELAVKDNHLQNEKIQSIVQSIKDTVYIYESELANFDTLSKLIDIDRGTQHLKYYGYEPITGEFRGSNRVTTNCAVSLSKKIEENRAEHEQKLKYQVVQALVTNTNLYSMMSISSREAFQRDLSTIINDMQITEHNLINLLNGFMQNSDKVIYDSIAILAGHLTSRCSKFKTNQKAFRFQNEHRLSSVFDVTMYGSRPMIMSCSSYCSNHTTNYELLKELIKLSFLQRGKYSEYGSYGLIKEMQSIEDMSYNHFEVDENITISVYKNGNCRIKLSKEFQAWLNEFLIGKNILK